MYHLCTTFGCLPSDIEGEDPALMQRLAYVDYIVQGKLKQEADSARN